MARRKNRSPKRNSHLEDQDFKKAPYGSRNRRTTKESSRSVQSEVVQGYLKPLEARTQGQERFLDAIRSNEVVILDAPAGCGKSFLSFGSALHMCVNEKNKRKIVLVRPIIPSSKENSLGYLPGSMDDKLKPYLAPMLGDSASQLIEFNEKLSGEDYKNCLDNFLKSLDIEAVSLGTLRGRNFNDATVILSEGQNADYADLKLFITRMGKNCKFIIEGDSTQTDLNSADDFIKFQGKLEGLPGIKVMTMGFEDIVRNSMLSSIIRRLDS